MDAKKVDALAVLDRHIARNIERGAAKGSPSDMELRAVRNAFAALISLSSQSITYLRDEGSNYEDDGSNEPLELARDIESLLDRLGAPA